MNKNIIHENYECSFVSYNEVEVVRTSTRKDRNVRDVLQSKFMLAECQQQMLGICQRK